MSKVIYKYGKETYSFETELQYDSNVESPEFQLEEHLRMEIKEHKRHLDQQPENGYIRDVVFEDDSGLKAQITDFINIGNIIITKR